MVTRYPVNAQDNPLLVKASDGVILAVKPFISKGCSRRSGPMYGEKGSSPSPGLTIAMLREILDEGSGAQCCGCPTPPAMVGEGYTALCQENTFDAEALGWAWALFETLGQTQLFPESLFDAVIAERQQPRLCILFRRPCK